jgi:hypothetical protein
MSARKPNLDYDPNSMAYKTGRVIGKTVRTGKKAGVGLMNWVLHGSGKKKSGKGKKMSFNDFRDPFG